MYLTSTGTAPFLQVDLCSYVSSFSHSLHFVVRRGHPGHNTVHNLIILHLTFVSEGALHTPKIHDAVVHVSSGGSAEPTDIFWKAVVTAPRLCIGYTQLI
jgi:hypothetical protein